MGINFLQFRDMQLPRCKVALVVRSLPGRGPTGMPLRQDLSHPYIFNHPSTIEGFQAATTALLHQHFAQYASCPPAAAERAPSTNCRVNTSADRTSTPPVWMPYTMRSPSTGTPRR